MTCRNFFSIFSKHRTPIYPIQLKTIGNDIRKNILAKNNTYKLLNSEYFIHVDNNINDKFLENFYYYIDNHLKKHIDIDHFQN